VMIASWIAVRLLMYARANRAAARTVPAANGARAMHPGAADQR
jgi:hypothetical protein